MCDKSLCATRCECYNSWIFFQKCHSGIDWSVTSQGEIFIAQWATTTSTVSTFQFVDRSTGCARTFSMDSIGPTIYPNTVLSIISSNFKGQWFIYNVQNRDYYITMLKWYRSGFLKKDRNHSPCSHPKIWRTYGLRTGALLGIISDIHRVLWVSADPVDV